MLKRHIFGLWNWCISVTIAICTKPLRIHTNLTAAYKIQYLTHTLASSISDIGESPKVTNVDLVMKSSISENFNNWSGCKTIELPLRMFDKNFFMKNLERYRTCRSNNRVITETALLPALVYVVQSCCECWMLKWIMDLTGSVGKSNVRPLVRGMGAAGGHKP